VSVDESMGTEKKKKFIASIAKKPGISGRESFQKQKRPTHASLRVARRRDKKKSALGGRGGGNSSSAARKEAGGHSCKNWRKGGEGRRQGKEQTCRSINLRKRTFVLFLEKPSCIQSKGGASERLRKSTQERDPEKNGANISGGKRELIGRGKRGGGGGAEGRKG